MQAQPGTTTICCYREAKFCLTDVLCRRGEAEPLLSFSPAVAAALPEAVRAALAGALQQVELLRGTRLFPVRLDVMPQQQQRTPATGDHAEWPKCVCVQAHLAFMHVLAPVNTRIHC
jgi:hypothetical protein